MKLLFTNLRLKRAQHGVVPTVEPTSERPTGDDTLGRGMDIALTMLVFLGLGWMIDRWLGVFPAFTIGLVVLAAVGTFVKLRYTYEAAMQRLESERRAAVAARANRGVDAAPSGGHADDRMEGAA